MSEVGDKRRKHSVMLAHLILYMDSLGYGVTLARGYASQAANAADGGHVRSLHLDGLAQDINLYDPETGEYIRDGRGHDIAHDYWDKMGGAKRIANDMNHYSIAYRGMR
jgi:hypothetical protein